MLVPLAGYALNIEVQFRVPLEESMKRYIQRVLRGVKQQFFARLLDSRWGSRKAHGLVDLEFREFFKRFSISIALSPNDIEQSGRLRHSVYCEEMKFEPIKPSGIESDHFDEYSHHCVIKCLKTGECVASLRIVLPTCKKHVLPVEQNCASAFMAPWQLPTYFASNEICEISRLAVKKTFRRYQSVGLSGNGHVRLPLTLYLYIYAANYCARLGIKQAYMLMEPKLARSMRLLGVTFEALGEPIEYHGKRVAYRIPPDTFIRQLSPLFTKLQLKISAIAERDISASKIKTLSPNQMAAA